ncbi:MAG: phospholipase D-like domain-containing protein [Holophagales bacterium]|nr:phospholipase D-like domain-containing protein [Holophagales bacterium]
MLDKSQAIRTYTVATFLRNAGISIYIDNEHSLAHNKIMIIDKEIVITGSFNFSKAAERNAENMLIIQDERLAKHYIANWERCKIHSEPLSL